MRYAPSSDLAPFVEHLWTVAWDRRGLPPFLAETLPHPSAHVIFERGGSAVAGVSRKRFTRELSGRGEVFSIKFLPGGLQPFIKRPLSDLTDRTESLTWLGEGWAALEERVLSLQTDEARVTLIEGFLRARAPARDPLAELATALVSRIRDEPEWHRVEDLSLATGMSERELQRLFRKYVGVSPKWVLSRYRLHEVLARIEAAPEAFDGAALAYGLGYCDQAHFNRDFRALVGTSPGAYAKRFRRA